MTEKMMLSEDQAIELFTFFIASARTQLDDPCHYASMRFLTAAEKLREFIIERVSPDMQKMLTTTMEKTEHAQIIVNDAEAYASALDELCTMTAKFLVEQSSLGERES